MFIAFLGCDGSGKSAVIAGVAEQLQTEGMHVSRGHWRPRAFKGEDSPQTQAITDNPHGQHSRGFFASLVKLGWLGFHWWVGWWQWLRRRSREGVVLYDRYHADLTVDPKRYRYGGPAWAAKLASNFMPQPDKVFFLDAEPSVLLSRKQEISKGSLIKLRAAYTKLAKSHPRFTIIDASRPLDKVIQDVTEEIHAKKK